MDVPDWGWNPSTVQVVVSGVVGVLTVLALFAATFAAVQSRNAATAARLGAEISSRESFVRTRPWVGLIGIEYISSDTGNINDIVRINYSNVGSLPAEDTRLSIDFGVDGPIIDDDDRQLNDRPIGTIFPQEPGFTEIGSTDFKGYRIANTPIVFNGNFIYMMADRKYATAFQGQFTFGNGNLERIAWQNTVLHSPQFQS